jgi:hypothetical protein
MLDVTKPHETAAKILLNSLHWELFNAGKLEAASRFFQYLRGKKLVLDLRFKEEAELFRYLNTCQIPSRPIWRTMRIFDLADVLESKYCGIEYAPFNN